MEKDKIKDGIIFCCFWSTIHKTVIFRSELDNRSDIEQM